MQSKKPLHYAQLKLLEGCIFTFEITNLYYLSQYYFSHIDLITIYICKYEMLFIQPCYFSSIHFYPIF